LNALIIFIKNPVPGKAKTRLAQGVGKERALEIYKSLLSYTRTVAQMVYTERYLYYSSQIIEDDWDSKKFKKRVQSGNNLGERMSLAFKEVLSTNEKALIIGSDCPQLNFMTISNAFLALDNHDFVIGPSMDGGYYLLGMKSADETVFRDIAWSTESVASQTIERIKSQQKTYKLLEQLSDVDYKEDWERYGWDL